jgi:CRP-like cAMP-binding protein
VIRGKIKSYQLNLDNAKEQTLFVYREGDMFDTIILLDGQDHDVMYEVMEESEVLQMPIAYVRELISSNKAFNSKFFPYLARQMRQMEELSEDLSLYSTSERLIKLLIQNLDQNNRAKYNLLQGLSNTEIAKLIGTVRHVVERHLKALKEDGTIETKNRNVQILDVKKLLDKINLF